MTGGKEPPDKDGAKTFKCHPKQGVTTVICLICNNNYHISDFKALSDPIFLSPTLVICPEHPDVNLTFLSFNLYNRATFCSTRFV